MTRPPLPERADLFCQRALVRWTPLREAEIERHFQRLVRWAKREHPELATMFALAWLSLVS